MNLFSPLTKILELITIKQYSSTTLTSMLALAVCYSKFFSRQWCHREAFVETLYDPNGCRSSANTYHRADEVCYAFNVVSRRCQNWSPTFSWLDRYWKIVNDNDNESFLLTCLNPPFQTEQYQYIEICDNWGIESTNTKRTGVLYPIFFVYPAYPTRQIVGEWVQLGISLCNQENEVVSQKWQLT